MFTITAAAKMMAMVAKLHICSSSSSHFLTSEALRLQSNTTARNHFDQYTRTAKDNFHADALNVDRRAKAVIC